MYYYLIWCIKTRNIFRFEPEFMSKIQKHLNIKK